MKIIGRPPNKLFGIHCQKCPFISTLLPIFTSVGTTRVQRLIRVVAVVVVVVVVILFLMANHNSWSFVGLIRNMNLPPGATLLTFMTR